MTQGRGGTIRNVSFLGFGFVTSRLGVKRTGSVSSLQSCLLVFRAVTTHHRTLLYKEAPCLLSAKLFQQSCFQRATEFPIALFLSLSPLQSWTF